MLFKILKEPIFWFLLLSISIFTIEIKLGSQDNHIKIEQAKIKQLEEKWQKEHGRLPTDSELLVVLEPEIIDEILYREAKSIGLELDDNVIRRRLIEKYRFMLNQSSYLDDIDEETLTAYYKKNMEQYQVADSISFKHHFFSKVNRIDPQGSAATAYLSKQSQPEKTIKADSFLGPSVIDNGERDVIERIFGNSFFADLNKLKLEQWSEPIQSVYGWHLVYITDRKNSMQLSYEQSKEKVIKSMQEKKQQADEKSRLSKLMTKYSIEFQ